MHSKIFLKGIEFSHSEGKAPVPTVRFSGQRNPASEYVRPSLENVEPYFDDERGLYLENKKTGKKEWVHPSKTGRIIDGINKTILGLVKDAAFLYWLTDEVKYAEFAESVFFTYIDGIYFRDASIDLENSVQQRISGLATFQVIHEKELVHLVLAYDFLHSYFVSKNMDLEKAIIVFQKWGDQIIQNGIPDNNWNLFQARIIINVALTLDKNLSYKNGKGREYFLKHVFDQSTERQIAIKDAVLNYDNETAIWPESPHYSMHTTKSFLEILTLLDNVSNRNELLNYGIIEKAVLSSFQYLFPSGYAVAFGDGGHKTIPPENFELLIANYRKYGENDKELLISGMLNELIQKGDYKREGKDIFELFFYVDTLKKITDSGVDDTAKQLQWPTFYAPNVSLFIQRMGSGSEATMVSTFGSYGNHSHVNGIAIELFANNYVLGPDMSKGGTYWSPIYREYYSQFPAHNTVVVDGISTYNRMRGYNPFTLDNYFPEIGESTTNFDKVTFSKVSFVEPKTLSDQQRLTAQIKSTSGQSYLVDIFRSRKKIASSQKHEYFYHNIGQILEILDSNDNLMNLIPTEELSSLYGDMKAYDYLTNKQAFVTDENIKAKFTLRRKDAPNNYMKMWIKGSKSQRVFSIKSPKSNALTKGTAPIEILDQKIPTIVLRRNEESWNNPFSIVFNPFLEGGDNPISDVKFAKITDNPEAEKIEVVHRDNKTRDILIINSSENDIAFENNFFQKGLLSIIRVSDSTQVPEFLFLSGVYKFEYDGFDILSKQEAATISIERCEEGFRIENDQPFVLKVPIREDFLFDKLEIYENEKVVSQKIGFVSRSNPDQMEFFLSKAYEKVIIVKP